MNNPKTLCIDESKRKHAKKQNARGLKFILHKIEVNTA